MTAGTASLLFEEAQPGEPSAFHFTAVPIEDVIMEEGPSGALDRTFRRAELTAAQIRARFPRVDLPDPEEGDAADPRHTLLEMVEPEKGGDLWSAVLEASADGEARRLGVLRLPIVDRRFGDPVPPRQLGGLRSRLRLLQHPDNGTAYPRPRHAPL